MKNNKHLNDNPKLRKKLRRIGLTLTPIGGICIFIGFIDMFSEGFPEIFWINFLGIFILFPGLVCLSYGYMGKVARYQAQEMAPIAKDTVNYMLDGTRDELSKTIGAVKGNNDVIECMSCGEDNSSDSAYCNHCGQKLSISCTNCNTQNDADSKYCKKCGRELEV
ncbi:MAG: zinc ribbon domain-containing protein [Bacilli bacterium]|nr:zinc ribbon domain-containing protein [Bacilli bacterium]